jgi:tetratricopeptide (TPR) repeat protein
LAKSRSPEIADEAIRLTIAIEQNRWKRSTEQVDTAVAADSFSEIRRLFDLLTKKKNPTVNDLLHYADFLLGASKTGDVPWLVDRIEAITPGSLYVLNLRVRQAKVEKRLEDIPAMVESWIQAGADIQAYSRNAAAGSALMQLGLDELGASYLKRAYEENAKEFRPYAIVLSRMGKLKDAIEVCIGQSESDLAPEAIALLADIAFSDAGLTKLDERVEKVFSDALNRFPSNATILESLGTLRLNQQRYAEAYDLLRRAEAIAPNNLMTLNNIAMTTSEIPGKEMEGLPRIKRAIELYGRHPELLDTLGVVQFRCGMLKEAEASLQEAVSRGTDPRFRLHLIQVLGARNNSVEIRKIARELNVQELRKMPLTASERLVVEEVSKNIGNESS